MQAYIEAENMRLESDPCQFSDKEIVISIEYKYCPNLTIIDTPGLIIPAPGRRNQVLQVHTVYSYAANAKTCVCSCAIAIFFYLGCN